MKTTTTLCYGLEINLLQLIESNGNKRMEREGSKSNVRPPLWEECDSFQGRCLVVLIPLQ